MDGADHMEISAEVYTEVTTIVLKQLSAVVSPLDLTGQTRGLGFLVIP
jgi:hypothetical protein